jgi:UDP-4-amino-4,6-dideoxy-N-acetyl-beta-L-altrosamine N-acetyltransferase
MFKHESVTLRIIEESDLEPMRKLRNDPTTWVNLTDIEPIDSESQHRWFQSLAGHPDRLYFVACDDEHDFLGITRMDEIDRANRSIRVGCDIVPEMRGQGYGSKVFAAVPKYSFDYMNMHRVWLAVLDYNQVGINLYKKHGFQEEGSYRDAIFRNGHYHDYTIMSLLEEEYRNGQQGAK